MQWSNKHSLFLLIGHSGVGKTTLLKRIITQNPNISIITKISTRLQRETDDFHQEIVLTTNNAFDHLESKGLIGPAYIKYGCKYGFLAKNCKIQIGDRVIEGVGLSVLDHSIACTVGDLFESQISLRNWLQKIVVVLLYAPPDVIKKRLENKKLPSPQLRTRLDSLTILNTMGMPKDVPEHDYCLSTDKCLEDTLMELQEILDHEMIKEKNRNGH